MELTAFDYGFATAAFLYLTVAWAVEARDTDGGRKLGNIIATLGAALAAVKFGHMFWSML